MVEEAAGRAIDRTLRDDIIREHGECMSLVAEVESCLDRPLDREGAWISALRGSLERLVLGLKSHFGGEAEESLYRDVPLAFPQLASRLEALASEHEKILAAAEEALRKSGRLARAPLQDLRELDARVQMLVATIRRHEAEENEILLNAYWGEAGAGD